MKKIIAIIFISLIFIGCEIQSNPVETKADNSGQTTFVYPTITIIDKNGLSTTYSYQSIWYQDGTLNIDFPGGCGISTPIEFINYFETSQINQK